MVVDVLRFSSSVVVALDRGAESIIPVKTLIQAKRLYNRDRRLILAGERGGERPGGFHLGNSPTELIRESLKGRTVVMTTTNGTAALEYSKGARWLLIGSFINAGAVSKKVLELSNDGGDILIVLASRSGRFFLEDFLCAGLLVSSVTGERDEMNDAAMAARLAWLTSSSDLEAAVKQSFHARYLKSIGYGEDVKFCLRRDVYDTVPLLRRNRIVRFVD
ncbi:2-phosphosulfolactate phosphatase [Candidatus Bathyarchaeota archaeon]|nr:2-phosphosulfolactate phosphatase [Candidatus Bathyarchaeota archaeon]